MILNDTPPAPRYTAPAIPRAARILAYLAESVAAPTLSDIARALELSKSTVHGLLAALDQVGWVERAGHGYRVGRGVLALARSAFGFWALAETARPILEQVAETLGVSVCLGRFREDAVVIEQCAEGGGGLRIALEPGLVLPRYAAATGKVFLSQFPRDHLRKLLDAAPPPRFTEFSVTDPDAFLAEVESARRNGYALDEEEYLRGVHAVAVPIPAEGAPVGAVWAVGLSHAFPRDKMRAAAAELQRAVALLSRLGTASALRDAPESDTE